MRDPDRLDTFYDELKNLHKEYFPDLRFLQLMMDYIGWIINIKNVDPFYKEEEQCLELFNEYIMAHNQYFHGDILYQDKQGGN